MNPETRTQLARLARQRRRRQIPDNLPCDWHPQTVKQSDDQYFTDVSAWEFIADLLDDAATVVEEVVLEHPSGRTAYVIKHASPGGTIYIKVHFDRGGQNIQGRSFHYSDFGSRQ